MEPVSSFVNYLKYERIYSERTVREYEDDLKAFESFYKGLDGELSWATLDSDVVRRWVVVMMERGNSSRSVNRRLSALRSFYRFLLKRGGVTVSPVYGVIGPKTERTLPAFLKEDEINRLLDDNLFASDFEGRRNRLVVMMLYATGIRLSELSGMNACDVNLAAGWIKVTGKRNKQRVIPFGMELREALLEYRDSCIMQFGKELKGGLLVELSGERMKNAKIAKIVRESLSLVTTLKKKSPHVLRHTFATSMLNHHANLESVKELLGHESLATTEVYTHTTFEELKKMYNKAHPRA